MTGGENIRIAIFGGSFNPPHVGHKLAAQAAVNALSADRLLIIPAYKPPHKEQAEDSPSSDARLHMTELTFKNVEKAQISDVELRRCGVSYTVDTLEQLKSENPDDEFILLMGTDMLLFFEQWRDYRRLASLAELAVFPRREPDDEAIAAQCAHLKQTIGADVTVIDFHPVDISSSALRELLKQRKGTEFFDNCVYEEIIKNRYYHAQPSFRWLRTKAYSYLDEKRVPHVAGCEREAIRLAERWGGNPQLAAEAAILHDITKKIKGAEQLKMCRDYGIITDTDEEKNFKLLHSKTGAEFSREKFGVSDEVYNAILWHTTGREDMSLLEKILYMADYIEPTRDFEGVEKLRSLAYEDLDRALILGLKMSMNELTVKGIHPHINSIKAQKWLEEHLK